jgi:APA family basic amino acid/polyamine antiporter
VASLIFLASFTLTHVIGYLARKRAGAAEGFQTPWFPAVPLAGGVACLAIGLYQALAVPSAGVLAALWLSAGAVLYALHLGPRARVVDASSEGLDPQMMKLRGRQPLVLVPIANPASAETMMVMAKSLAPPAVSRVQLLSVVGTASHGDEELLTREVGRAQSVLGSALKAAIAADLRPEALVTLHDDPWREIVRVAQRTGCESILLGIGHLDGALMVGPLGELIQQVDADVVILRAPPDWHPDAVKNVLVPSRGGREQSPVRARLLGSLARTSVQDVTFLGVLPERTDFTVSQRALRGLRRLANDEIPGQSHAEVILGDDVVAKVLERAADTDLLILGLNPAGRRGDVFGDLMLRIAQGTSCPLLMISQRR